MATNSMNADALLSRESVFITDEKTRNFYCGKRVLVTGCGSIGTEICRQIAACSPSMLITVDVYENNLYAAEQELLGKYGKGINLVSEVASVRDRERMEQIISRYQPDVIFHTAAHKHVPLMENNACEAVKNNIFGTLNIADLAEKYSVKRFILISTDKAVNPTGVMGASKRFCEMMIQSRNDSNTVFSAVRFGNVLDSNGSVIPLFRSQIANGGPVTVTDKRMTRYFMTISEASQLVMQAGIMAKKGELFVLDMGEPVKIIELAESVIRQSGYEPYRDIEIVETGLRPGEKLYEELLIKGDRTTLTTYDKIYIERDMPLSREEIRDKLGLLKRSLAEFADTLNNGAVVKALKAVVPEYR